MTTRSLARLTLGMLVMTTAGCGAILGLDQNYQEGNPAAGGAGGTGSAGGKGGASAASSSASGASGSAGGNCAGVSPTCGLNQEDCCASESIQGGTFRRDNNDTDTNFQGTVSDFKLDRFEVTVGRFRKFIEALPISKPAEGTGKHPKIAEDKGWEPQWSSLLPSSKEDFEVSLKQCDSSSRTWTSLPSSNESKPINCVSWFEAFAFCIWDGGRLPTELEWNYAAIGGDEQRLYPWGNDSPIPDIVVFNCNGDGNPDPECDLRDIDNVGKLPGGDARWKQADLGASMTEWLRDIWDVDHYAKTACTDCAFLDAAGVERVVRGGSWSSGFSPIQNSVRAPIFADRRQPDIGLRCARD